MQENEVSNISITSFGCQILQEGTFSFSLILLFLNHAHCDVTWRRISQDTKDTMLTTSDNMEE